jgi:hypothetical protein
MSYPRASYHGTGEASARLTVQEHPARPDLQQQGGGPLFSQWRLHSRPIRSLPLDVWTNAKRTGV